MKSPIILDKARFIVLAPECIRIEYSENKRFVDEKSLFGVCRKPYTKGITATLKKDKLIIDTGKIKLVYRPDGRPFHKNNIQAYIKKENETIVWFPGKINLENLGGTVPSLDGVLGPLDVGEGIIARDGWYLLDDSKTHILEKDWAASRPEGNATDWYLFGYGSDYKAALKALTKVGGVIPMPRKYSLGSWYSRYWPYSSKDYRQIVKEYQQHDFPIDVMVLDMDWHKDGWTGWSWNRELLPDAEELLQWLHKQNIFVTLNLHSSDGVGPHEDQYEKFMKELGKDASKRETIPFDASNKKWLDAVFKHIHAPMESDGVDFWWLDISPNQFSVNIPDLSTLRWANHCYYKHTSRKNQRGLSFSRWGGWGDHRNPIHFSGDAHTDWPMLAFEVLFNSTAANVGCFFWSHDIGGHVGPRNEESFIRWVQFGATTAALRLHSTRHKELDRRPWTYSDQAEKSTRIAFHTRSNLFPYIYSSVRQSYAESIPLNRPMYIEHPEDERAYNNPQQYLFGDALLAAPIVSPGAGPGRVSYQIIWFPKGLWYNWFTGERYTGNTEEVVTADINEFPLFARGGVPIPMQPYTPRMTTEPLKKLIVRCYPGENGKRQTCSLYEDDGITQGYTKGEYATTELSYHRKEKNITVTIEPTKGSYKGLLKSRSYIIELPCTSKATSASVNGRRAEIEYDSKSFTNKICIAETPTTKKTSVKITAQEAENNLLQSKALSRRIEGILGKELERDKFENLLIKCAKTTKNPREIETLLAMATIALHDKGIYSFKKTGKVFLYNSSNLIDKNKINLSIVDKYGEDEKIQLSTELGIKSSGGFALPSPKHPLSDPLLGKNSCRTIQVDFKVKNNPIRLTKIFARKESYCRGWHIVGPFVFDPSKDISVQKHPPEKEELNLSSIYKGPNNTKLSWRQAECNELYLVNLRKYYDAEYKIAYAVTWIDSPCEQQATFKINSDDGVETWINGKKIHSHNIGRVVSHDPDIVKGILKRGNNLLLMKISQYSGEWGFKVGIECPTPVKEVKPRLQTKVPANR